MWKHRPAMPGKQLKSMDLGWEDTKIARDSAGVLSFEDASAAHIPVKGDFFIAPKAAITLDESAVTFAVTSQLMIVTGDAGANVIATITGGLDGMRLVLLFVDALVTITDTDAHTANTVDLAGVATDFVSADDSTLELISDGTSWYELSRSVN